MKWLGPGEASMQAGRQADLPAQWPSIDHGPWPMNQPAYTEGQWTTCLPPLASSGCPPVLTRLASSALLSPTWTRHGPHIPRDRPIQLGHSLHRLFILGQNFLSLIFVTVLYSTLKSKSSEPIWSFWCIHSSHVPRCAECAETYIVLLTYIYQKSNLVFSPMKWKAKDI